MGTKLSPKEAALYKAVDEVLHYVWDPIGVSAAPQARDEYHSYLPDVFSLLCQGGNPKSIAAYLGKVATGSMGLPANTERDLKVANILVDWKEAIDEQFA
jgi:hypothetical protein